MTTKIRLTTIALLAAVAFACSAPAALAKGPETGTLTGPGIDRPIVFIDQTRSIDAYESSAPIDLLRLSGLWYAPGTFTTELPADPGPRYTLTWVNMGPPHLPVEDRTIVQYLYLDTGEEGVIHTPEQPGLDGWGPSVIGSFVAPEGLDQAVEGIIAWAETAEGKALQPESMAESSTSPLILILAAIGTAGVMLIQSRMF